MKNLASADDNFDRVQGILRFGPSDLEDVSPAVDTSSPDVVLDSELPGLALDLDPVFA